MSYHSSVSHIFVIAMANSSVEVIYKWFLLDKPQMQMSSDNIYGLTLWCLSH